MRIGKALQRNCELNDYLPEQLRTEGYRPGRSTATEDYLRGSYRRAGEWLRAYAIPIASRPRERISPGRDRMSDSDWLSQLDPAPPEELATAMRNALKDATENPTAEDLLEAAERMLDKVLRTDCETRASALDLLTVDALMTHALAGGEQRSKSAGGFP